MRASLPSPSDGPSVIAQAPIARAERDTPLSSPASGGKPMEVTTAPWGLHTWRPDWQNGCWVAGLIRTDSLRAVRDAVLGLAHHLHHAPEAGLQGVIVVQGPSRIAWARLEGELHALRALMHPGLLARVHVARHEPGHGWRGPAVPGLRQALAAEGLANPALALAPRLARTPQHEVTAHLLRLALAGEAPGTLAAIGSAVGASHPTVLAAVRPLRAENALRARGRQLEWLAFPWETWRRWVAQAAQQRETLRFHDPSGLAPPAWALAQRLGNLGAAPHLAITGVLAASHRIPELDLTGAPWLDLAWHAPPTGADPQQRLLPLMQQLDPGLQAQPDADGRADVVVHLLDARRRSHFEQDADGLWADALDALLVLHRMGLQAQAEGFIQQTPLGRRPRTSEQVPL